MFQFNRAGVQPLEHPKHYTFTLRLSKIAKIMPQQNI